MTERKAQVEYYFPESVEQASRLKARYGDQSRFIAGGTDLLLVMERENDHPSALIDLTRIPSLQTFEIQERHAVIGAAVTLSEMLSDAYFSSSLPFLAKAIRSIGGVQVRNIATLVGNVVNASPAGDTLPVLYTLNARVHIDGLGHERSMPIDDFVLDVGQTALGPAELVTTVTFDLPDDKWIGSFQKLGLRKAMAISVANVAVLLKIENDLPIEARIALGAVAATVIRAPAAEEVLVGNVLDEHKIDEAANLVMRAAHPIDDIRGSAKYRRMVVGGLLRRALRDLQSQILSRG